MAGIRNAFFVTLASLGLIMLFSCSLLPGDLENGVIAIKVGVPPGSRALEVKEYDVESLDIEIYGPGDVLLTDPALHWVPPGPRTYTITGIGPGMYRIVVTHNGVNGDATLSVTEGEEFEIAVMKITRINVIPGLLGVIEVEGDEPDPIDVNGYWTVTWEMGGMVITPLYTYMEQTGTVVEMAHGFSGTLEGNILTTEGLIEGMGFMSGTGIVDGDRIEGDFTITDEFGTVVMEGFTTMVRTDTALFGHMDITGVVDGTVLDLDTEFAMAHHGFEEGEDDFGVLYVNEYLDINFIDEEYDVYFMIDVDSSVSSLDEGQYDIQTDINFAARYLVNGVGFDESNSCEPTMFHGTLYINEWVDDVSVTGSIVASIPGTSDSMTVNFSLPFSESGAF